MFEDRCSHLLHPFRSREMRATTPLLAYPLPSSTLVVLFPSRVYNLQFASNLCISLLPDLPKTGNHQKSEPNGMPKKQQGSRREPCCFAEFRGSAPLRVTSRKGAVLDELTQETLLAYKNRAAALHRFTNKSDHLLSLGLHQGNPGGRGSGVWIVLSTPVGHFHQNRDEIETFFSQDILLFSLIFLRELFHQKALLFQVSETACENVGRHPFF